MNAQQALEKLELYKEAEGQSYEYKSDVFHVNKVIAAPQDFEEFKKRFQDYIADSKTMVTLGLSNNYDIYFFDDQTTDYLRLDSFINECVLVP